MVATVHANSAREALVKRCTLPLLAGDNISPRSLSTVAARQPPSPSSTRTDETVREIAKSARRSGRQIEVEPDFHRETDRLILAGGVPRPPWDSRRRTELMGPRAGGADRPERRLTMRAPQSAGFQAPPVLMCLRRPSSRESTESCCTALAERARVVTTTRRGCFAGSLAGGIASGAVRLEGFGATHPVAIDGPRRG